MRRVSVGVMTAGLLAAATMGWAQHGGHPSDAATEPHRRLLAKLKDLIGHIGCETMIPSWSVLDQRIPLAGVAHQCGTVRFGTDPATSALDVTCRAHDVDNLYVVDTSCFPSSTAVNPALTAMANALRVGDHLIDRLGARVHEAVGATA